MEEREVVDGGAFTGNGVLTGNETTMIPRESLGEGSDSLSSPSHTSSSRAKEADIFEETRGSGFGFSEGDAEAGESSRLLEERLHSLREERCDMCEGPQESASEASSCLPRGVSVSPQEACGCFPELSPPPLAPEPLEAAAASCPEREEFLESSLNFAKAPPPCALPCSDGNYRSGACGPCCAAFEGHSAMHAQFFHANPTAGHSDFFPHAPLVLPLGTSPHTHRLPDSAVCSTHVSSVSCSSLAARAAARRREQQLRLWKRLQEVRREKKEVFHLLRELDGKPLGAGLVGLRGFEGWSAGPRGPRNPQVPTGAFGSIRVRGSSRSVPPSSEDRSRRHRDEACLWEEFLPFQEPHAVGRSASARSFDGTCGFWGANPRTPHTSRVDLRGSESGRATRSRAGFVSAGSSPSRVGELKMLFPKKSKKKPWDDSKSDLSRFRATPSELLSRRLRSTSPHAAVAAAEYRMKLYLMEQDLRPFIEKYKQDCPGVLKEEEDRRMRQEKLELFREQRASVAASICSSACLCTRKETEHRPLGASAGGRIRRAISCAAVGPGVPKQEPRQGSLLSRSRPHTACGLSCGSERPARAPAGDRLDAQDVPSRDEAGPGFLTVFPPPSPGRSLLSRGRRDSPCRDGVQARLGHHGSDAAAARPKRRPEPGASAETPGLCEELKGPVANIDVEVRRTRDGPVRATVKTSSSPLSAVRVLSREPGSEEVQRLHVYPTGPGREGDRARKEVSPGEAGAPLSPSPVDVEAELKLLDDIAAQLDCLDATFPYSRSVIPTFPPSRLRTGGASLEPPLNLSPSTDAGSREAGEPHQCGEERVRLCSPSGVAQALASSLASSLEETGCPPPQPALPPDASSTPRTPHGDSKDTSSSSLHSSPNYEEGESRAPWYPGLRDTHLGSREAVRYRQKQLELIQNQLQRMQSEVDSRWSVRQVPVFASGFHSSPDSSLFNFSKSPPSHQASLPPAGAPTQDRVTLPLPDSSSASRPNVPSVCPSTFSSVPLSSSAASLSGGKPGRVAQTHSSSSLTSLIREQSEALLGECAAVVEKLREHQVRMQQELRAEGPLPQQADSAWRRRSGRNGGTFSSEGFSDENAAPENSALGKEIASAQGSLAPDLLSGGVWRGSSRRDGGAEKKQDAAFLKRPQRTEEIARRRNSSELSPGGGAVPRGRRPGRETVSHEVSTRLGEGVTGVRSSRRSSSNILKGGSFAAQTARMKEESKALNRLQDAHSRDLLCRAQGRDPHTVTKNLRGIQVSLAGCEETETAVGRVIAIDVQVRRPKHQSAFEELRDEDASPERARPRSMLAAQSQAGKREVVRRPRTYLTR
ncbi:UNVERIFIED_CONTAM: hypothetical protein HHA_213388 [Hammondia hammondi]|eukprot:XP_008884006.1 hypothetical protein HHA_213388 [Hammondia hammondi]